MATIEEPVVILEKPRKSARIKELKKRIDPPRVVALLVEHYGVSHEKPSFEDEKLFRKIVKLFPRMVWTDPEDVIVYVKSTGKTSKRKNRDDEEETLPASSSAKTGAISDKRARNKQTVESRIYAKDSQTQNIDGTSVTLDESINEIVDELISALPETPDEAVNHSAEEINELDEPEIVILEGDAALAQQTSTEPQSGHSKELTVDSESDLSSNLAAATKSKSKSSSIDTCE